jgi:hypothetical protein
MCTINYPLFIFHEEEEQSSPAETEEVRWADVGHTVIAGDGHSEGNQVIQEETEESPVV